MCIRDRFEKASVAETAAEMYLAACRERFDLVLLDPPYRQGTDVYKRQVQACELAKLLGVIIE